MLLVLLKINLLLALLAMVYYFALRKLTFYRLNRYYLLAAIACSAAYPFIDLSPFFTSEQQTELNQFLPAVPEELTNNTDNFFLHWLGILFLAGVGVMTARLIRQFISLYQLHRKAVSGTLHHIPVKLLQQKANPFSFGKHIYINPALHTTTQQETILAHEKVHVQQWHTLDIVLAELLLLCCWCNPAAWFIKKAVRENLEFITDEEVIQKGFDRKLYQYSLLQVSTGVSPIAIANKFTLQDIKKRIQMMNGRRSSRLGLVSYIALPLLLTISLLFTVSAKKTKELVDAFTHTIENITTPGDKTVNATTTPANTAIPGAVTTERKAERAGKRVSLPVTTSPSAAGTKRNTAMVQAPASQSLGRQTTIVLPQENKNVKKVRGYQLPSSGVSGLPTRSVTGVPLPSPGSSQQDIEPIVVVGYATGKKEKP